MRSKRPYLGPLSELALASPIAFGGKPKTEVSGIHIFQSQGLDFQLCPTADPSSKPTFRSALSQPSQMGNFKHQPLRGSERERDLNKERERDLRDKDGQDRLRSVSVHRVHYLPYSSHASSSRINMTATACLCPPRVPFAGRNASWHRILIRLRAAAGLPLKANFRRRRGARNLESLLESELGIMPRTGGEVPNILPIFCVVWAHPCIGAESGRGRDDRE